MERLSQTFKRLSCESTFQKKKKCLKQNMTLCGTVRKRHDLSETNCCKVGFFRQNRNKSSLTEKLTTSIQINRQMHRQWNMQFVSFEHTQRKFPYY